MSTYFRQSAGQLRGQAMVTTSGYYQTSTNSMTNRNTKGDNNQSQNSKQKTMVRRPWKNVGANQEPVKGRLSEPERADHKPLLTRETKGNNASTPQKHGVRMANVTGLSWSLPIMVKTM